MESPTVTEKQQALALIEQSVGELYRGLFQLHQLEEYQEAYDAMGTLLNMLTQDRLLLMQMHIPGDKTND